MEFVNYAERIARIAHLLAEMGVPYTVHSIWNGAQLRFPWSCGDVACHAGTYGSRDGYVETYEFSWDKGDVSMLTPEEAAARIAAEYFETKEE